MHLIRRYIVYGMSLILLLTGMLYMDNLLGVNKRLKDVEWPGALKEIYKLGYCFYKIKVVK